MCGRFVEFRGIADLKAIFPIDQVETEVSPNYNVVPKGDENGSTRTRP